MALRRIDAETLLTPPEPPKDTVIMFGLTGYAIRVTGKGASLMELDVDGSDELASIGKDAGKDIHSKNRRRKMTDNDYRIEDRSEKGRPNYTLRRVKFAAAVVGLIVSVTLMLTWRDSGNMAGALLVEGVYLATALWLVVRFASRRPRLRGVTDEGDSAALAFQSERSGQGRRHEEDDEW